MTALDDKHVSERMDEFGKELVSQRGILAGFGQSLTDIKDSIDALILAVAGKGHGLSKKAEGILARAAASIPARPMHVLVVDDDPHVRLLYRKLLRGAKIEERTTAQGARDYIGAWGARLDLVILDYALPDDTTLAPLRYLRSIPGGEHVPVVVCSAYGRDIADEAHQASGPNTACHVVDKTDAKDWFGERLRNGGFGLHEETEP